MQVSAEDDTREQMEIERIGERPRLTGSIGLVVILCVVLLDACKKTPWLVGSWLLISEDGKPGSCHQFEKDRKFNVYVGSECKGPVDPLMSGKYQLKKENKLAVLRGNEEEAHLALITERDKLHFVASGAISGNLYKVEEKGAATLMSKLESKGVIKVHALPMKKGCRHLSLTLKQIQEMPKEPHPRMIRQRDQGLAYHVDKSTGDPKLEKIVYALNQDVIEWVAFHLAASAFQAPGPRGRLEKVLGSPVHSAATGSGEKRQHIAMWRAYCKELRGAKNKDVDLTLFSTAGKQRGTIYVSENVLSDIWRELLATANDPSAQATEDEDDDEETNPPKETPPPAPIPAPVPTPTPTAAPTAKKAPPPEPALVKTPPKAPVKPTSPDDDDI